MFELDLLESTFLLFKAPLQESPDLLWNKWYDFVVFVISFDSPIAKPKHDDLMLYN